MGTSTQHGSRVCFVGLANLPVLAREYGHHGVGGAEVQQTLLARALARRGFDVSMIVMDYGQPDGASWDGIRTWRAYHPRAGIPVLRFIHPRWTSVWAALKRADASVYYVSGAGMIAGLVALFCRRYGRKMVLRIASQMDCNPETLCIQYSRDRKLYAYGLKHADIVLAQTVDQQRALAEHFGRNSVVAPSVSDTIARRLPFAERDIDVLWVGNLRGLKQPELLLQLARALPRLRFEMAGGSYPGDEALFESVRREAASIPNLKFHGAVPFHDMKSLYERARLLVATSRVEGFPNTYLQAWAHGAPVVAFLDPDEILSSNELGRAVTDMNTMRDAVVELLGDAGRWQETSARCCAYFDRRTDENVMLAPYFQALRALSAAPKTLQTAPGVG
jgi:glycosyltransferase involved in cell wall biosynthesis